MYHVILMCLMICGCSNPNSPERQPKTYKNTPSSQHEEKKWTVRDYWDGHPVPPLHLKRGKKG